MGTLRMFLRTTFGDGVGFLASSWLMSSLISALTSLLAVKPRSVPNRESSSWACKSKQLSAGIIIRPLAVMWLGSVPELTFTSSTDVSSASGAVAPAAACMIRKSEPKLMLSWLQRSKRPSDTAVHACNETSATFLRFWQPVVRKACTSDA